MDSRDLRETMELARERGGSAVDDSLVDDEVCAADDDGDCDAGNDDDDNDDGDDDANSEWSTSLRNNLALYTAGMERYMNGSVSRSDLRSSTVMLLVSISILGLVHMVGTMILLWVRFNMLLCWGSFKSFVSRKIVCCLVVGLEL